MAIADFRSLTTRARFLDDQLLTEDGRTIPLDCVRWRRHEATSDTRRQASDLCVVRPEAPRDPSADTNLKVPEPPIDITSRDLNGVVEWHRLVQAPVRMPQGTPAMTKDVFTSFLGFGAAGLVFSVELVDYQHLPPGGGPNVCTAYLLGRDDAWRKIGALVYYDPDRWKCNFPGPWTDAVGFEIAMGKNTHAATDGQPDPNDSVRV